MTEKYCYSGMIKFIRQYVSYDRLTVVWEVVYYSGRLVTYIGRPLPKTAVEYINTYKSRLQYDKIFKREEVITCADYGRK